MHKIFLFTLITSLFVNVCTGQLTNLEKAIIDAVPIKNTVKEPNEYIKNDSLILIKFEEASGAFPVIKSINRPDVADKINLMLQITHLSQVPLKYKNNDPFIISDNNFKCGQTNFLGYSVSHASENILKIEIEYEQTYCTGVGFAYQTSTEYYDLFTGNKIIFDDLFSKNEIGQIKQEVINSFRNQFDNNLNKINKELHEVLNDLDNEVLNDLDNEVLNDLDNEALNDLDNEELNDLDNEALNAQLELYTKCKEYTSIEYFNGNHFIFTKNGIQIIRNYCWGNESTRSVDSFSSPSFFLKYKDYIPKLSEYGKFILGYSKSYVPNTSIENKIAKGMIGDKYPIKAVVFKIHNDGSLNMLYWYDKTGIPISLEGDLINETITLIEKDSTGETIIANISAKLTDNKIDGFWTNYKTKQKLRFLLETY